jgi:signal transduction histidine kinase
MLATLVASLAVFGALIATLTLQLRTQLRAEVLQREAEAIHAVAQLQVGHVQVGDTTIVDPATHAALFAAVLESSRLRGVLAVQLFDAAGILREALPEPIERGQIHRWWPEQLDQPQVRFNLRGSLENVYGLAPEPAGIATAAPLLEVVVPLLASPAAPSLGTARYWIDGGNVAREFDRMDRGLLWQAGAAFVGGAAAFVAVLAWAFGRLAAAQQKLLAQSADLRRANQELDLAAKTGAIGAISAHLIHGLKNPLSGLEGFVAENAASHAVPGEGEAWQAAVETTRRLRTLVNEVVTVLRDEVDPGSDYRLPVDEVLAAAKLRVAQPTAEAGVELVTRTSGPLELPARTANLALLILTNLLNNAIEASPRGAQVMLEAQTAGNAVDFVVRDTGPGVPAAVRENLFRPLRSTKSGGGGIGLAISHQLARHAQGELALVRSDARGSVFRLRVPQSETAARAPASTAADSTTHPTRA